LEFFPGIFYNRVFMVSLVAWAAAQSSKVIILLITTKKLDFGRLVGSGGMPSSHSAFVMSLSTGIGLMYGWESSAFAIALAFSLVVMYDAAGVRRSAGKQAEILNIIIREVVEHKGLKEERLKELIGHTPIEVIVGAILGIIIANLML